MFSELNYQFFVTDVAYYFRDYMMALCVFGDNQLIFIYNYDLKGKLLFFNDDIFSVLCNQKF